MTGTSGIDWLVDPSLGSTAGAAQPDLSLASDAADPASAPGWHDELLLADGWRVFRAVHRDRPATVGHLLQIGQFPLFDGEATLVAEVLHDVDGRHREFIGCGEVIYRPGANFFRHAARGHDVTPIATDSAGEMAGIAVADSALDRLLGEELAGQLLCGLGLEPAPVARVVGIPLHVSAPLRAIVSSALEGPLMRLFAQAKALEYLCALAVHVTVHPKTRPRQVRKRDIVRRLHDELAHLQGKVPTLDQLARECGISPKTLNEQFIEAFGQSIYSFITECRLRDAHSALQESDVPMKVLAARLGYSHVNNFINAFGRKFGYSPGSLRRGRRADDA